VRRATMVTRYGPALQRHLLKNVGGRADIGDPRGLADDAVRLCSRGSGRTGPHICSLKGHPVIIMYVDEQTRKVTMGMMKIVRTPYLAPV
jgi:hypothetical protein